MSLQTPAWFTLTASEIASDSRLEGHFLNARLSDDGFTTDIYTQIPIACAYVTTKIRSSVEPYGFPFSLLQFGLAFPLDSQSECAVRRDHQIGLACEAAKERIISGLYRMLPGTDNLAISEGCRRAADDLLTSLVDDLKATSTLLKNGAKPGTGTGAFSMGYGGRYPRLPGSWNENEIELVCEAPCE